MKKLNLLIILGCAICLAFSGCGKAEAKEQKNEETKTEAPAPEPVKVHKKYEVQAIFDVKDVAGQSQSQVTAILGEPKATDKWDKKGYVTVDYGDATDQGMPQVSVLFVNDVAVRITVNLDEFELKDPMGDNLPYIGLPSSTDMEMAGAGAKVMDINGLYRVQVDPSVYQIKIVTSAEYDGV